MPVNSNTKPKIELILYDSYIQAIKNSVGSKLFRNLYAYVDGKKNDILENGLFSCAIFVSSILYFYKLIGNIHATVDSTIKDLEASGWQKVSQPKEGAILIWEPLKFKEKYHKHIGFYMNEKKAISNSTDKRSPILHHWTFGTDKNKNPKRKILNFYWHKKLDSNN